ncbi:S24 family peptidase [Bauldia litoralis]|uniref:S24 family peptidase n=1 Tax=Bauldia litoralis TaxID=665467 RepID=UPI003264FBDC
MDSHASHRLRRLRERLGLSMEDFAKALGYKGQSSVQRYEDPDQYPDGSLPPRFIAKLLDYLPGKGQPPVTVDEVTSLGGEFLRQVAGGSVPKPAGAVSVGNADPQALIPIFGQAVAGEDGVFEFSGEPVDHLPAPTALAGVSDAYGVYVQGDSMEPRYFAGEIVYVHPRRPPTRGCFVVVQLRPEADGGSPPAYVKRFMSWGSRELVLEQFNPAKELRFTSDRVLAVHRIVMSGDG